jgi:hypothetical protein
MWQRGFVVNCVASLLAVAILLAASSASALAAERRKDCHSVYEHAEITLPSSLILNVIADSDLQYCAFYVALPPQMGAANSIQNSARVWFALFGARDNSDVVAAMAKDSDFGMLVTDALLEHVSPDAKDGSKVKILESFLREHATDVDDCAYQALVKGRQFDSYNDFLACGLADENTAFVVTASYQKLSTSLSFPMQAL